MHELIGMIEDEIDRHLNDGPVFLHGSVFVYLSGLEHCVSLAKALSKRDACSAGDRDE